MSVKTKKGLLVCVGGMSTTMIRDGLNKANDEGYTFKAMGTNGTEWITELDNVDIILISPQVRFLSSLIIAEADKKNVPYLNIPPQMYLPYKASELWALVKEVLDKK